MFGSRKEEAAPATAVVQTTPGESATILQTELARVRKRMEAIHEVARGATADPFALLDLRDELQTLQRSLPGLERRFLQAQRAEDTAWRQGRASQKAVALRAYLTWLLNYQKALEPAARENARGGNLFEAVQALGGGVDAVGGGAANQYAQLPAVIEGVKRELAKVEG